MRIDRCCSYRRWLGYGRLRAACQAEIHARKGAECTSFRIARAQ